MKLVLLAFAALASAAVAAPATSTGSCALQCNSPKTFAYGTGKSYVYDYSIDTITSLVGVAEDDAALRITAQAHIDVTSPCEFILRVTNVNMEGSSHVTELAEALTKYPLKFSFQDGMIDNICSDISEPSWVLNVKRGLLSHFQNNMALQESENVKEKDVSGICNTIYKTETEGDLVYVQKTTDLASCSLRPDFPSVISSSYNADSPIQNMPLLKTTNKCNQEIQGGILRGAQCEEIYSSRPFMVERGMTITKVKTSMVLLSEEAIVPVPDFEFFRKTLVFEDTDSNYPKLQLQKVKEILNDLVTLSREEVTEETPVLFSELVDSLKKLDQSQLNQLFTTTETLSRKFLVDAIPLVGTPEATAIVSRMILEKEMNDIEADLWFTSLAFYKNPSKEMFSAIAPLLEGKPSQKALLGSSALINNYCKINMKCETEPEITNVIQLIEVQIGAGCRTVNEEEKTRVLVALKALGNAGRWVRAKATLEACYREENEMEVRVAALDAWRHTPCEYDRSEILNLFQDESFDPELRIAAYLSLMSCPTPSLINIVKEMLISRSVDQVGSFIWTHMTNMQESAVPEKEWMHEMIGEEFLQKKFNVDSLKFSRNYESSFFTNVLNIGGSAESNIIFNSKSYLPRSGMLNLTLDLFGESINFLEVGGRIEGFEAYIERFFGSNGYFPEKHIEQILKNMRSTSDADSTTLEGFLDRITDEPEGSYYLRVFGHELHYHRFQGLENLITSPGTKNPMDMLMDLIRKGNLDYTKSFQVLDTHMHIPTISGLPLILDSKVTGTMKLEMKGNLMAESMKNFNVEGRLLPSAALKLDGHMLIDAQVAKAGVKLSSTLHTSTFVDGKIQISDNKVVDISLNTPKEKIEFIDVKGEYFYVMDDQEIKKEAGEQEIYEGCSNGILGMTLCGKLKHGPSTDLFLLGGPFEAKMYMQKTDTQTGYIFRFMRDEENLELVMDTPGSQKNNKLSFKVSKSDTAIEFDIETPVKSVKGSLEYTWTSLNKNIKGAMTVDNDNLYSLEAGLLKTVDEITTFEPSLVLTVPVGEILNIKGILKSQLAYYDTVISSKIDISYKWGSQQMIHIELDASKKLTESKDVLALHAAIDPTQFSNLKSSVDVTLSEVENQEYKTEVTAILNGESYILQGMLQDNCAAGKLNIIADATLTSPTLNIKTGLGFNRDSDKTSLDLKTTVNGQNYDVKIELTKASLLIDAIVIQHVVVGAYVSSGEGVDKLHISCEWNKDVDPTAVFLFDGKIAQDEINVYVKFINMEGNVSGKLLDHGLDLEANWGEKKISAIIGYTLGETKSLTISIVTPFTGFEKQDFTASITLKNYEIIGRIICTWKNTQQLALNVNGKLIPGLWNNALHAEVLFSSSFSGFEKLSLKLDHEMATLTVKSSIVAIWDQEIVKTVFEILPKSDGLESSLSFESPITEKLLITLNHVQNGQDITSIIEGKYGEIVATAALKGHIDIADVQNVILSLQISIPSILEIIANVNYKFDWTDLQLIFEGVMGEKKVMLNVNGDLVTGPTTKFDGNIRFITPFTYPISATIAHTNDANSFESMIEMTRFWSDYGTLKVHSEGHKLPEDILFSAELTTPATKASVSLSHKIADTKLFSSLDININGQSLSVKVSGVLDLSKTIGNIVLKVISTFSEVDGITIAVDSTKEGAKRTTKLVLAKGEHSVSIDHILTATDPLNWENIVNINGKYKLRNTQVHSVSLYAHEMEWIWEDKTIYLSLQVDNKIAEESQILDGLINLVTPWTDEMKGEVHLSSDGHEYKSAITVEYAAGKKIDLQSVLKNEDIIYSKSTLTTPFSEVLEYDLTMDLLKAKKAASLGLSWGSRQITLDTDVEILNGKLNSNLKITSTSLTSPITANISYDIVSPQKTIHLLASYIQNVELKGLLSGDLHKGDFSLALDLPAELINHVELTGNWNYEPGKASTDLKAVISSLEEAILHAEYDILTQKEAALKVAYGTKVIEIVGKIEEQAITIDLVTPFIGFEHLKITFFLSATSFNIAVSKNDLEITAKGTLHIKSFKGKADLSVTTPFVNYEALSAELQYSLRGPVKYIEIKSSIPAGDLQLNGEIDVSKDLAPTMKLVFVSPFEIVKKMGGEASWDLTTSKKTALVQVYKNDLVYQWELEVAIESKVSGYIKSKIITPLPGMTTITVEGILDLTKSPYEIKFALEKEGTVTKFEGYLNIGENGFNCQLLTPFVGWEAIALSGKYELVEDHLTGTLEINKDSDKYILSADILYNLITPKVHITLNTPIALIANVELVFDSTLNEPTKSIHATLKINEESFNIDAEWHIVYKTALIKILAKTPIPLVKLIDAQVKYDFTERVKTAEIDLKIENESKLYLETQVSGNRLQVQLNTPLVAVEMAKIIVDYNIQDNKYFVSTSNMIDGQQYDYSMKLVITEKSIDLSLQTPTEILKSFVVSLNYEITEKDIKAHLLAQKNDEKYELDVIGSFLPLKSSLLINVITPIEGWKTLALGCKYDLISEKKSAEIVIQKEDLKKEIKVEGQLTPEAGSIKLEIPIPGYEVLEGSYTLNIDTKDMKVDASLTLIKNSEEWKFAAQGQYSANMITISFQTPFEDFKTISVEGQVDFEKKLASLVSDIGAYKFTSTVSYEINNILFELTTPFDILKIISVGFVYDITAPQKEAKFTVKYNDKTYDVTGSLNLTPSLSELLIQATTPFEGFNKLILTLKYDAAKTDELLLAELLHDESKYSLKIGAEIGATSATVNVNFVSTLPGWTHIQLLTNALWNPEEKYFEFSLGKEENLKAFDIIAKLNGILEGSLIIRTPIAGMKEMGGYFKLAPWEKLEGNLDITLPLTLVPKIHGDINLLLKGKIQGEINLQIAEESFSIKSDLVGASLEDGYTGKIEIDTPLHALSKVVLNGNLIIKTWTLLQTHLKADLPFGSYEIDLKGEFALKDSAFLFDLDTTLMGIHRKITIDSKYPSLNDLEILIATVLDDQSHQISGKLNVAGTSISGEIAIESTLIGGKKEVSFDISIPTNSNKHFSCSITLLTEVKNSLTVDINLSSGVDATLLIDSPLFPKVVAMLKITDGSAILSVEMPQGKHLLQLSWKIVPSDYAITVQLMTPLLPDTYTVNAILQGDKSNLHFKSELTVGSVQHVLESTISITESSADILLAIETPLMDIGKATLSISLKLAASIEIKIATVIKDQTNTFDLVCDKEGKTILVQVVSPLIPTGMVKFEGQVIGETVENLKIKLDLQNAEKAISGQMNIEVLNIHNMKTEVAITTPFEGFLKMKFGAEYVKNENTSIVLFVDEPIKGTAKLLLSITEEEFIGSLKVETSTNVLTKIDVEVKIPLVAIAPKMVAKAVIGNLYYGGNFSFRLTPPYEIGLKYTLADKYAGLFHIRTDSSFFSLLS